MDKSYIYLISQLDNVTNFIMFSKTGYTDKNPRYPHRATAIQLNLFVSGQPLPLLPHTYL